MDEIDYIFEIKQELNELENVKDMIDIKLSKLQQWISDNKNLTKHNSSSKKDCSFCNGNEVHIVSQEGNDLGKTNCPICSPS